MMDAQVERGYNDAHDEESDENSVDAEVFWEAALEAKIPDLA